MKKVVLASLSAIALFGIAACSDTDETTTQSVNPPIEETTPMAPAAPAPEAAPTDDAAPADPAAPKPAEPVPAQ